MKPINLGKAVNSLLTDRHNDLLVHMYNTFPIHHNITLQFDTLVDEAHEKLSPEDWQIVKTALNNALFRSEAQSMFYYVQGMKDSVFISNFL